MLSVFVASLRKLLKVLILSLGLYPFFVSSSNKVYEKSLIIFDFSQKYINPTPDQK